jgi:hypothetical protein
VIRVEPPDLAVRFSVLPACHYLCHDAPSAVSLLSSLADAHDGIIVVSPIPPPPRMPELTAADRERLLVRPFWLDPVRG